MKLLAKSEALNARNRVDEAKIQEARKLENFINKKNKEAQLLKKIQETEVEKNREIINSELEYFQKKKIELQNEVQILEVRRRDYLAQVNNLIERWNLKLKDLTDQEALLKAKEFELDIKKDELEERISKTNLDIEREEKKWRDKDLYYRLQEQSIEFTKEKQETVNKVLAKKVDEQLNKISELEDIKRDFFLKNEQLNEERKALDIIVKGLEKREKLIISRETRLKQLKGYN